MGPGGGTRPEEPGGPFAAGRASVPKTARDPLRISTDELPLVRPTRPEPQILVSWHRPSRERLRNMSDGWGLSATGLLLAFMGWGVWAAAGRAYLSTPLLWFGIVCGVGLGVFVVCRLLGRIVVGQLLRRPRQHARWAHAITGLYLTVCGFYYFGQADWEWIQDGIDWVQSLWS